MNTNDKNKFETKIRLNNAIMNKEISKKELDFILKHIYKNNLLLVKQYNQAKNIICKNMLDELNKLLQDGFFVSDKILILYIARKLNQILNENGIDKEYENYIKEKSDNIDDYNNKYAVKLNKRSIIYCDDGCYNIYLPLKPSELYYSYGAEKTILYPQFDSELNNLYNSKRELTENELNNIKNFKFSEVNIDDLKKELDLFIDIKEKDYRLYNILQYIKDFEGIIIYENNELNFDGIAGQVYRMIKNNQFDYNVNDKYFILYEEVFKKYDGYNGICRRLKGIKSINSIIDYIKWDEWKVYMETHDIKTLTDLYYDKDYDFNIINEGVEGYIDFNFNNKIDGIKTITKRIMKHHDIMNYVEVMQKDEILYYDVWDDMLIRTNKGYVRNSYIKLGNSTTELNKFIDRNYLSDCVYKCIE